MRPALATSLATLAIAAAGLVHAPALDAPWYLEDLDAVVHNPYVKRLTEPLVAMRAPPETRLEGRPLASLTLAANHALGGREPRAYRIFALFVHVTTAILWFEFLRRFFARTGARSALAVSAAAALLWVVHPLHSTTILFAAARPESLAGLFFVATLLCAVRALEESAPRDWSILCVLCCALGMACSEVMLAAPIAVLCMARTLRSGSLSTTLAERKGLHGALFAASLVLIASWRHAGVGPAIEPGSAVAAAGRTAWSSFVPLGMAIDHSDFPRPPALPDIVLGVVFLGVTLWTLGAVRRQHTAATFLCGSWLAVLLFTGLHPEADAFMERQTLLPSALAIAGACSLVSRIRDRAPVFGVLFVLSVIWFGALSIQRALLHQDPLEAWRETSDLRVANTKAANRVTTLAQEAGMSELAEEMRQRSLTFDPRQPQVLFDRALEHDQLGMEERARHEVERALELEPDLPKLQLLIGYRDALRGDLELALPRMTRALNLQPDLVHDQGVREAVLLVSWNLAVAEEPQILDPTQVVVWLTPLVEAGGRTDARVLDTLAVARAAQRDYREALRLSRDALAICEREGLVELERDIERRTLVYSQAQPFRVRVLDQ